jgi:hypothetical protein
MAFPLSLKFHPQELEITRATWCRDTLSSGRVFLWSPSYRPLDRGAFDFSTRSSFPDQMEGDFASKRRPPMFEKIDPLPRPQGGPPQHDRDRQLRAGQGRADVGGHIKGPSSTCRYRPAPSGASRSKNVCRSARTSGAAFSWMSNPAEVCRQNKVKSPVCTPCGLSQSRMSCVISTSPRPRDET